jgi:hypothetical protein
VTYEELELITRRDHLLDTSRPYLWISDEILTAFNWAEREAARRARLLVDSRTFSVGIGTDGEAVLDPRVIFVKRAKVVGASRPLLPVLQQDLDMDVPGWEDAVGEPRRYVIGGSTGRLLVYPRPEAAIEVQLTVVRMPLAPITSDGGPEISWRFHDSLLHGACHRLFLKQDADTQDLQKAAFHLAQFEQEFGPKSSAIDETWIRENYSFEDLQGVF